MEYFYSPPKNRSANTLTIDGEEFTHLTHVMRKHVGDELIVVDGKGTAYETRIDSINKRTAECSILNSTLRLHELTVDITLAVGLLKNPSRFDFLVEKATELGINRIVPLLTERTIPRHAKSDRWQKIALAAMKQSGRCVLPTVDPLTPFGEFAVKETAKLKILPHEKSANNADTQRASSIAICIGPEGGFTDGEVSTATENGFVHITLGERRLRTETAAIAAICRVLF